MTKIAFSSSGVNLKIHAETAKAGGRAAVETRSLSKIKWRREQKKKKKKRQCVYKVRRHKKKQEEERSAVLIFDFRKAFIRLIF